MQCSSKYCYYNNVQNISDEDRKNLIFTKCQQCNVTYYCSDKCRMADMQFHKAVCQASNANLNEKDKLKFGSERNYHQQQNDDQLSDVTSLRSMQRSVNDYEQVNIKNKTHGELGQGSYGSVKLFKEKKSGELYAIKIMTKKLIFDYSTVENLKREIKIQKRLSHPHVCKLIHYFEDKLNVYLVLEYCENGSLFQYLKKKKYFTEKEAFVYFFQTCLGIDYLHKKNVVHRDLKPENLLLDKTGNIKMCDFGWCVEVKQNHTRTTFCGTMEYMAPEMLDNKPHNYKLDIWCLGVLLYELLHGYAPFTGASNTEKSKQIHNPQLLRYDEHLSKEAIDLIRSILRVNPDERPSMMQIFHHPWMRNYEKEYNIVIDNYIYQNDAQKAQNVQNQQIYQSIQTSKSPPSEPVIKQQMVQQLPLHQQQPQIQIQNAQQLLVPAKPQIANDQFSKGSLMQVKNLEPAQQQYQQQYQLQTAHQQDLQLDSYLQSLNLDRNSEMQLLHQMEQYMKTQALEEEKSTQASYSTYNGKESVETSKFNFNDLYKKPQDQIAFNQFNSMHFQTPQFSFGKGSEERLLEQLKQIQNQKIRQLEKLNAGTQGNIENYNNHYSNPNSYSANQFSKETLDRRINFYLQSDDNIRDQRTSRISTRNKPIQQQYNQKAYQEQKQYQQEVEQEKSSFMDDILMAFGCMKRMKPNK